MSEETGPRPTFGARLGGALVNLIRFILRLILVLIIGGGIGAAVYFGAPYLYNKFILPVETNTARLSEIESKQAADVQRLAGQVDALQTRLGEIENRQTANAQALAEMQGQVQALETAVATQTETLKQLETLQTALDDLTATSNDQQALLIGKESSLAELQRQISLSRAIELLSRGRLFLSQSNFGLAGQDIQAARDLLATLQEEVPDYQVAALGNVIWRLDLALDNLPDFPVIATDDVDVAWQLLMSGLPTSAAEVVTPISSATEVPTETPEVIPTVEPTGSP